MAFLPGFFMLLTHLEIAQQQEMFTQKEFELFLIVSIFFTFFRMLFSEFLKQWFFFLECMMRMGMMK